MVHVYLSLSYTCFAQIARPSTRRFVRVFQDNGAQILSVTTSTDTVFYGDTLVITTNSSFFTNRMYYLLADSGVCMQQEVLLHYNLILSITGRPVNVCRVDESLHVVL